jgi:hypothetical protein
MSSANNQVFGNDVTVIDSTQVYPLGTERLVLGSQTGKGDQVWRYVYNSTAAAFTEGQVVTAVTNTAQNIGNGTLAPATNSVPKLRVLGVAQTYTTAGSSATTFGAGAYGWVLVKGEGSIRVDATVGGLTADTPFVTSSGAQGSVSPVSSPITAPEAAGIIGVSHVAIAASTVGSAYIDCRP